jgi:hypothetical protein
MERACLGGIRGRLFTLFLPEHPEVSMRMNIKLLFLLSQSKVDAISIAPAVVSL